VASGSSPKSGSARRAVTDRDEVARPELDSRRERASAIAACQERHKLERSVEWRSKDGERVIASCTWPPRRWTDADGYSEVTFKQVEGPGYEEGEATGATLEDHLRAEGCRRFALAYEVTQTGENEYARNRAASGNTVTPYTDSPAVPGPTRAFPDEVIVQHTFVSNLQEARCVG
jgi:hypothetical protein